MTTPGGARSGSRGAGAGEQCRGDEEVQWAAHPYRFGTTGADPAGVAGKLVTR
jgi:hypothetical protein